MDEEISKVSLSKAGKQNQPSYVREIVFTRYVHCSLLPLLITEWIYKFCSPKGRDYLFKESFGTLRFSFLCKQLLFIFNLPEGPGLSGAVSLVLRTLHGTKQSVPDFKPVRTLFHLFLLKHLHNFPRASQIISDKAEILNKLFCVRVCAFFMRLFPVTNQSQLRQSYQKCFVAYLCI